MSDKESIEDFESVYEDEYDEREDIPRNYHTHKKHEDHGEFCLGMSSPTRRDPFEVYYGPSRCQLKNCARDDCFYSHSEDEVHYHPLIYKTKPCLNSEKGKICKITYCPYKHDDDEPSDNLYCVRYMYHWFIEMYRRKDEKSIKILAGSLQAYFQICVDSYKIQHYRFYKPVKNYVGNNRKKNDENESNQTVPESKNEIEVSQNEKIIVTSSLEPFCSKCLEFNALLEKSKKMNEKLTEEVQSLNEKLDIHKDLCKNLVKLNEFK